MPRVHREGLKPEPLSTSVEVGQNWKHRWNARTVRVTGRRVSHRWNVESEGRANYLISEYTLKRDYRLVD